MIIRQDDIGNYFVDKKGEIYICRSYCPYPSATLEKLTQPNRKISGSAECLLFQDFKRLEVKE